MKVVLLLVRDGKIVWEPRGAWKHVVNQGSFAQPALAVVNGSASPSTTFSSGSAMPSAAWRLRDAIIAFFDEHPGWE